MRSRIGRVTLVTVALVASLGIVACGGQTTTPTGDSAQEEEQIVTDPQKDEDEQDEQASSDLQRDPADPPVATITYEANGQEQSAEPMACSSTWSFEQDGQTLTVTTDAPHPVEFSANGMPAVNVGESTPVTASFDVPATEVSVRAWSEMDILTQQIDLTGDAVEVQTADDGTATFSVQPGFRYALVATFDAGEATYVFTAPTV